MSDEKETTIFYQEGGGFLAPGEVGSSMQWFVRVHTYEINHGKYKGSQSSQFQGCVNLTDCDRKISWGVWDVEKLDRAIAELRALRASVVKAKRLHAKHKFNADEYE